jgi:DNA-binding PadR family transcriptional regulator
MYADNTLTPKEATRLCALGILADGPIAYAELASGVRHFVTHVMGPSLDVLGTSIELLKHEGLVTSISGQADKAVLEITAEGTAELKMLLKAKIKTAENDLNKLIIALKFRYMDLLDSDERRQQLDLLSETFENEQARLEELRAHHVEDSVHLVEWLDREIEDLERRLSWLNAKRERV